MPIEIVDEAAAVAAGQGELGPPLLFVERNSLHSVVDRLTLRDILRKLGRYQGMATVYPGNFIVIPLLSRFLFLLRLDHLDEVVLFWLPDDLA